MDRETSFAHRLQGNYDEAFVCLDRAREYYDKYLELNDAIKNELGLGYGRFGLGNLHHPDSDRESLECAEEIFREVINSSTDHSEVETAMYCSALNTALQNLGRDEDMIAALREGPSNWRSSFSIFNLIPSGTAS